jgi:outer membrane protein OmpA-like peptidoglycan-associated protein/uncharacterized protein YidB (DUF937 family)
MFERLVNEIASRFNLGSSSVAALVRGLLGLMTNEHTGGVNGFMDLFRHAGLGEVFSSWFGGKETRPVTGAQIESALGVHAVDKLANSSGLSRSTASSVIAALLPKLIGQLTPNGVLPSTSSLLSQVSSYLALPVAAVSAVAGYAKPKGGLPKWLPWAAVAALAVLAWLWFRDPVGTINPQLTVTNQDGRVTYSGLVRDESTRTAINDALRASFGAGNVSGDVRIDRNVKRIAWSPRLGELVGYLKRPGVEFSLDGDTVSLGGWLSAADRQALTDRLRAFFGAQTVFTALTDRAAEAVRTANTRATSALAALATTTVVGDTLVETMNLGIINFASGSADIPAESQDVIRQSAEALKRARAGTKVEIGGHTDNTGDAAGNLKLSQSRAEAVKNAFVAAGVSPAMLTTAGYGDTRPRATNDTEFGRFQNRRIEYALVR